MSTDPAAMKAQADAETAVATLAKLKADARAAEAAARVSEREAEEADAPSARAKREAETRKAIAEADKEAAAARREQVAALIPDLGKVEPGSLEIKGDQVMLADALSLRALDQAAETAVKRDRGVGNALPEDGSTRVLLTSEADLATSDAAYHAVDGGLDQLARAAEALLDEAEDRRMVGADAVVGAVAQAVPGLLSLLSSRRTVTTAKVTVGDLAAAAAMAGALRMAKPAVLVVHDDFRLLPAGAILERLEDLRRLRQRLIGEKLRCEDEVARVTAELAIAKTKIKSLAGELEHASEQAATALKEALELARRQAAGYTAVLSGLSVRLGLVDSVTEAIDAFTATVNAVPAGERRSLLTHALMREQLHGTEGASPTFTHVLLIKGEGGSASQAMSDRPLWSRDKFSVIATASVTYMLIETSGSSILTAGTASGSAAGHGSIGSRFDLEKGALG